MEDWNDLKLVLAVHRAGSLTQAAQALAIDHSTAFRRLKALETRLDVRLFERLPGGVYQTTPAGARMAAGAERMEDEALALDRDIVGGDHRLSGQLRITSSETLAYSRLTSHLASFRRVHPGIVVELVIENRVLSLSRREADIALRPVRPKEGELWGRKLADMAWALYAAPDYLEAHGALHGADDIDRHAVIGWEAGIAGIAAADWLGEHVSPSAFVYRSNSLVNQSIAAKAGVGITLLPCYLGDSEAGLARALTTPIAEIAGELWIVTHVDLKQTARVRAFFDLVGESFVRERDLFEGRRF
ncbi:LysR family transcriptional regulator [Methylocella sp. CPCC 101449]|uniref:LysR family transcriptional regulator n=1 Tax=Methylocella sp. CPCC 101449 TaxID=2987531 RepID=UPI002890DB77|nr:LysR family transcriptional regulator [Methylocella sp. CPCC 101449]MDT2021790.1 LysR family transcriptional regulator [Methylocella sp. CPCC 101449]